MRAVVAAPASLAAGAPFNPASLSLNGQNTCAVTTSGTWVGSVTIDGTNDFLTYTPISAINAGAPITTDTSIGPSIISSTTLAGVSAAFSITSGAVTLSIVCSTAGGSGGSGGSSFTPVPYPYNGTGSETRTNNSFVGVGGLSGGAFQPLALNNLGYPTIANTAFGITGPVTVTFPYSLITQGQTPLANSGVGMLCVFNVSPITLTSPQATPCQADAVGNINGDLAASSAFGNAAGVNGSLALSVQGIPGGVAVSVTSPSPANTDSAGGVLVGYDGTVAAGASPLPFNLAQVGGSAVASPNAGYLPVVGAVGLGSAPGAFNPLMFAGQEFTTGTNGFTGTAHGIAVPDMTLDGDLITRPWGSSHPISCTITFASATTTQCAGAATGTFVYYITDVAVASQATNTAGTITVENGTGTNCNTSIAAISPPYNISGASVNFSDHFQVPLFGSLSLSELCVKATGTTVAEVVYVNGYLGQ